MVENAQSLSGSTSKFFLISVPMTRLVNLEQFWNWILEHERDDVPEDFKIMTQWMRERGFR